MVVDLDSVCIRDCFFWFLNFEFHIFLTRSRVRMWKPLGFSQRSTGTTCLLKLCEKCTPTSEVKFCPRKIIFS
jgi:hypothetical protein